MDKIPFDVSLGIDLENFKGILLVYDEEERLLGYIATYDGSYTLQTSFAFVTPYDDYGNVEYYNVVSLLADNQITKGYIEILKFN